MASQGTPAQPAVSILILLPTKGSTLAGWGPPLQKCSCTQLRHTRASYLHQVLLRNISSQEQIPNPSSVGFELPHKRLWPCATQVRLSLGKADGSPQFSEGEKEQEPSVPAITFLPLLLLENIISVSHFVHQMPKNLGGERHNPARMAHGCATAWCSSSNEPASVCAGHGCHRGRQQGPGMARCHHTAVSSRE